MPKSMASSQSVDDESRDAQSLEHGEQNDTYSSVTPTSPALTFRRFRNHRASENDLSQSQYDPTERSSLLGNAYGSRSYTSMPGTRPGTPPAHVNRHNSQQLGRPGRLRHSRAPSFSGRTFSQRLVHALGSERRAALGTRLLSA